MNSQPHTTVPGLDQETATRVVGALRPRLFSLLDLQLTLKHVHWNVVGPSFLSVHEMLDTMVGPVRDMTDATAERIRTLGGVPRGTPGAIVAGRDWDDYGLDTESVYVHLKALDPVFTGIVSDHRDAIELVGELDPVTEDLLIAQTAKLEEFQWFIRSFVERAHQPDEDTQGRTSSATAAADRRDAASSATADRAPTESESAAADRAAGEVDTAAAGEHFDEMAKVGANVDGEGSI